MGVSSLRKPCACEEAMSGPGRSWPVPDTSPTLSPGARHSWGCPERQRCPHISSWWLPQEGMSLSKQCLVTKGSSQQVTR